MTSWTVGFLDACWIVFWAWWGVSAWFVKRDSDASDRRWSFLYGSLVLGMYLLATKVPGVWAARLWPFNAYGLLADLMAAAGLVVLIWARVSIGRNWSGEVVLKQEHELVSKGPYAWIRHPIYAGLGLMMLATSVLWGTIAGFVYAVVFIVIFRYKSKIEEKFMTEHFPEAYPAYMRKTKAFIPFIY